MVKKLPEISMDAWLALMRSKFVETAPDLLALFETYAAEAKFGRLFIDADLKRLRPSARVLEVGAGSLLLSCQLVREGFDVTALEPVGEGFRHFDRMRSVVWEVADSEGCAPKILDRTAEALDAVECFDFAFSINVMEHVNDVKVVLDKVGHSLTVGGVYHFTCPNYSFPYEPHFNIPTLFSKKLTERVLHRKIYHNQMMPDPLGTWKSLNWISVDGIRGIVRRMTGIKVTFSRSMFASSLTRIAMDKEFANRRSPLFRRLILMIVRLRIHLLLHLIPAGMQPIMDCRIEKTAKLERC